MKTDVAAASRKIRVPRPPGLLAALVVLAALLVTACATGRIEVPIAPGIAAAMPRGHADPFDYARRPVRLSNHTEGEKDGYVLRQLELPSVGENGQEGNVVSARYYERVGPGRKPLVVVLPIWGTYTYPPAIVTRDLLADKRVNVMRVLGKRMVIDWDAIGAAPDVHAFRNDVRRMVQRVRTTVVDLRRLLDWAEERPAVDGGRVGIVGFSESSLQAAGVMASDPRLAAAVLVMGGARPHEMFATCYGPPAAARDRITRRFGWTRQQFADALEPLTRPIDLATMGSRLSPERVLIFEAANDDCVPAPARDALWDAAGRPTRVHVLSTHAGSFVAMTFLGGNHIRHRIVEFLGQTLP